MTKQEEKKETKDSHPLITLGLLTAGTQMGTALIQRMAKHPVILFTMGMTAGMFVYKNRKQIVQEARELSEQSKKLISRKSD
jgi:zinc transporter ZupT